MKLRFRLVQTVLFFGFALVITRLGYLQVWRHDNLRHLAEQQSNRLVQDAPRRGPILDRHGEALVESVRVGSCYADPRMIRDASATARRIATVLDMPVSSVLEKLRTRNRAFVWVKRFVPVDQAQALEQLNLPGIGFRWEYRRSYPQGPLAAHLLGFVGAEGQGLSGVELALNEWLVDSASPRRTLRDGRGSGVGLAGGEEEPQTSSARLTIDRTLQYIAERELEAGMKRSQAKAGHIVVQDPWTGEILAMASRPNLSFSDKRPLAVKDLKIPPLQWAFEPGSTFKIVTAAAALETGRARIDETFDCENGKWKYSDITINDHSKENILTFAQVMERSSNIGFAKVSLRLGKETLHKYIRAFGFGTLTGCEIPGETAGLLNPLSRWSGVSLPVISFGQEVGVTAVQLAAAYSAVANGGRLMEPRLFQQVRNQRGETKTWDSGSVVREVVSPETCALLNRMFQGVVERGTGQNALLEGWTVAGKTGTAQKIDPKTKRYSPDKFVASFCGYVPTSRPRLTIVVVYDEPKGISWGGYNAGPIFKNVAWHGMTYLGVPPDRDVRVACRRVKASRT